MLEALQTWLKYLWSEACGEAMRRHAEEGVFEGVGYEHGRVQRVLADVDPRNQASLRLLKSVGFEVVGRRERTFETHLGWCDSVDLELGRPGGR